MDRVRVLIIIAISSIGVLVLLAIEQAFSNSVPNGAREFEINVGNTRDPEKLNYKGNGKK